MSLHHSIDLGNLDRKFLIRYHERQPISCYNIRNSTHSTQKLKSTPQLQLQTPIRLHPQPITPTLTITITRKPSVGRNCVSISIEGLPGHLQRQQKQKDFPRIPIDYNDEKINGSLVQANRLRVVYRGYAPKNSYFYIKALTGFGMDRSVSEKRKESELQFSGKFQSGNLGAVARKSPKEFFLYMREDTNTFGLRQWFYYSVTNKKAGKYKFRIYKFSKVYSLYKEGMKPFIRVMGSNQATTWNQGGQNIKYEKDPQTRSLYLEFEYQFLSDNMTVEFATQPPYTYSMLRDYLKSLSTKYPDIQICKSGQTLSGLQIPKIYIQSSCQHSPPRKSIVILTRTHPSETSSNWALEGMIERIYQLPELRASYDFHIIPMLNPDGVFFGNHRTGVLGQDINRKFNGRDAEFFPQVSTVQTLIQGIQKDKTNFVEFLIDLHGHSARRNIFAYGDNYPVGSHGFLKTHILPKLLDQSISSFKYSYCVFRSSKCQKQNTARVFLSKKYHITAITFEQSYGIIDQGCMGIQNWRNFGSCLADCLQKYTELFRQGQYLRLKQYLHDEIEYHTKKQTQKNKKQNQSQVEKANNKQKTKTKENEETKTSELNTQNKKMEFMEHTHSEQISEKSDHQSSSDSELSSGDQDLENSDQAFQQLKKEIRAIGCMKNGVKRQIYMIPERNIVIKNNLQPRLHEKKIVIASRFLRLQQVQQIQQLKNRDRPTTIRYIT